MSGEKYKSKLIIKKKVNKKKYKILNYGQYTLRRTVIQDRRCVNQIQKFRLQSLIIKT